MARKAKEISPDKDVPPAAPARNYAARGIAGLLAPVVRPAFRRRAPAAAALLADWEQLAGPELAAKAAPIKFAGGTLTLGCTAPAAMELQLLGPEIMARLNLALGQVMVERLRFVAGGAPPPALPLMGRVAAESVPDNLPEGALGEAFAKLYRGMMSRGPR